MTLSIRNPHAPKTIRQRFVKSRFGYYVHTTHGIAIVGEVPLFAFTRKRAERKAERLADKLRRDEQRWLEAETVVR